MDRFQSEEDKSDDDESDNDCENNDCNLELEGDVLMFVLQNRSKLNFSFPEDLISTSWFKMASRLPVQNLQIFLQAASNDEFKNTLLNLTNVTVSILDNNLNNKTA